MTPGDPSSDSPSDPHTDQPAVSLDDHGLAELVGISSRAFEHPADRTALTALRAVPGFDQMLRAASGLMRERQYRLVYLSSAVRVGERQFADLHALLGRAVHTLDLPERPELYVFNDPRPQAITLGVDRPFIAMSSGLYEITDDDERLFVIGHEVGHAMSGHALYQSMLLHLISLVGIFGWVPGGAFGLRALLSALREWQRKAELSGDRAGLLVTQDLEPALRVHMKLAGGAHLDRIDVDAFLEQAAEYEAAGDLRDGVLKLLNTERQTHPFAVVRAAELRRWASTEEYPQILAGDYPRREDDRTASFSDSAREAARAYKRRIDESNDPLVGAMRNVGTTLGSAADSIVDWLNRKTARPTADGNGTGSGGGRTDGAADGSANGAANGSGRHAARGADEPDAPGAPDDPIG